MSETQTASLTDFLLQRIAEDEREANVMMAQYRAGGDVSSRRWRRVLAECAAKRRIVELHGPYRMASLDYCSSCGDVPQVEYPCDTLRALALSYADHPDFRAEWRP